MTTMSELSCAVKSKLNWLVMTFATVLILSNLLLSQQNNELKARLRRPDRALELKLGTNLPPIEGADISGNSVSMGHGQDPRKTLLLVFSPQCRSCKENMPNWQAIISGADRQTYRLAAVSLRPEGAGEYLSHYSISDVPVIADLDPKSRVAYNLALTPQTILLNSDGRAEKVWTGVLSGAEKQEVEQVLNIRLP